ncbi:acyl-CoA carboxylase epsilon subunit [Luteimicrobium subarcticum]|uniref:Acyl-CoA carboxylase epsilon subunit-like protein n=1 Tax=Luteimicrobium subarcticum TaxID=620910 RepID=A0A2M8WUN2_9MICO|nr:acyl-CoA carboxylase epsilon subunit [Luteimicrobium subarcticum]PJI94566.1 acyl-CoA carboxylase epsilon subunit-like protein [Luteimicrobium subarcticum]
MTPADRGAADDARAALPQVRVVRGEPDELEIAALVAGLAAASSGTVPDDVAPVEEWTNRTRVMRGNGGTAKSFGARAGRHNADSWRWSLRS